MAMTPAMESIFANAQQNAASLIETATLAINAKVNTIEEAEAMIQELSSEAVKFNELLTCIMNAMRQVESGDMQKEEAAGIIAPAVKELKDKCTALKIANVEAPGDDITEDEIATLRELIIGAKAAAEDRLVAIRLCDDCKVDPEVENELNPSEENGEAFEFNPATEGISSIIQKMHAKKVNKAKVTVLMDSLKDKKTDAIVKKVVDAMKPALVAGADGLSAIKRDVDEMKAADGDPSKYEGKLSSFDYVVKTISGVGVGYIPENPSEGTGLAQIMVPTKDRKGNVIGTVITVRTACEYILNPIKESEVTEAMEAYEEIAEEATILAAQYVNTTECKTAKALYQNAKKLYSMGSKEKALEYMKKSKDLYDKCLKKLLNESGKFEKAERTDTIKKNGGTSAIRHNVTRTDSLTFAIARSKLETKIDRCTAHILQWTTKAGKETYQQTLDQLKADREQAKAAKKAAKATENYEMEDNTMILTDNYDQMLDAAALEAMDYEEIAEEGTNWDQHKMKKSYSKEVRSLAKEAKKLYRHGKYSEAKNMYTKCVDLCKQFIADVKAIPQEAKDINFGAWMYALRTMFIASDSPTETIDRNIELLNKQGKGELTPADFNKYTQSLISEASALAKKYQKLADKAAKGELDSKATESFDYDEFMFACESFMDELQIELDTDCAMEADGAEDGEADSPSTLANRVRGAFAKLRRAFKRGDKKEVEEAKKEADSAAKELADAAEAAPADKKEKYKKAAKIAGASVAATAVAVGLTMGGTAIYQKAKGQDIDPTALFKIAGQVGSKAVQDVGKKVAGGAQAVANAPGNIINSKKDKAEVATRKANLIEGGTDAETFDKAANKNMLHTVQADRRAEAANAKAIKKDIKVAKKNAKKAAKSAMTGVMSSFGLEAYGISSYDVYEVILEAMMSIEETEFESDDAELTASIEAML